MNTYDHNRPCLKCGQKDISSHFYEKGEKCRPDLQHLNKTEVEK